MKNHHITTLFKSIYVLIPISLSIYVYQTIGVQLPPQENYVSTPNVPLIAQWRLLVIYSLLFYIGSLLFFNSSKKLQSRQLKVPTKTLLAGILLTFLSYAIGGFFVDLNYMWFFINN